MATCRNCGSELYGRFCHTCGQKAVSPLVTLRELVHEAIHEFAHLDDSKIVQTLKLLLFKPGELTAEFLRGRRARYVPPLRLYLVCSLLFFAIASWSHSTFINIQMTKNDIQDDAEREAARKETVARLEHLRDEMTHNAPRAMFVLMPVFGLFTWALFRRAQPYYVPHLYYALHLHAFVFLMLALRVTFSLGGRIPEAIGGLFPLIIGPYHYIGLRRVFGGTRWQIAWKGTVIAIVYFGLIFGIMLGLLVITMRATRLGAATPLHLP